MRWVDYAARMGEERKLYKFFVERRKERDLFENRGLNGRMVSEWILGTGWEGFEWVQLAQVKGQWRDVVNAVMNLGVLSPRN
jgi:hypothetical protein